MNRELLSKAVGDIDARYIAEAYRAAPETAAGSPERNGHMKIKRIVTLALAAVLLLSLGIAAYAAGTIGSPQTAEKVAREQIEEWKTLGLLSQDFTLEGAANEIYELQEREGGAYWFGRIFRHRYSVRWHFGLENGPKYGCILDVDTQSGKITSATLYAVPDADDEPVRETQDSRENGYRTLYFYDNYEDIIPAGMTVDRYCSLLAEYWGFSGYRLADTVEDAFYHENWAAVDGSTPLRDLGKVNADQNYYLTVYFEGDPDGAPMYIQLLDFPGHTGIMLGTNHGIG